MITSNKLEKRAENIRQNISSNIDFEIPDNLTSDEQQDIGTTLLIMNNLVSLIEVEDNAENQNKHTNLLENL